MNQDKERQNKWLKNLRKFLKNDIGQYPMCNRMNEIQYQNNLENMHFRLKEQLQEIPQTIRIH